MQRDIAVYFLYATCLSGRPVASEVTCTFRKAISRSGKTTTWDFSSSASQFVSVVETQGYIFHLQNDWFIFFYEVQIPFIIASENGLACTFADVEWTTMPDVGYNERYLNNWTKLKLNKWINKCIRLKYLVSQRGSRKCHLSTATLSFSFFLSFSFKN